MLSDTENRILNTFLLEKYSDIPETERLVLAVKGSVGLVFLQAYEVKIVPVSLQFPISKSSSFFQSVTSQETP